MNDGPGGDQVPAGTARSEGVVPSTTAQSQQVSPAMAGTAVVAPGRVADETQQLLERIRLLEMEIRGHNLLPRASGGEVEQYARQFKAQMLTSERNIPQWVDVVEKRLQHEAIPEVFWSGVAYRYIGDELVMRLPPTLTGNWPALKAELLKLAVHVHPIPDALGKAMAVVGANETLAARRPQLEQWLRRFWELSGDGQPLSETDVKRLRLLAAALLFRRLPENVLNAHNAFKAADPLQELVTVAGETLPRGALAGKREETRAGETLATECYECHKLGHFARDCPTKKGAKGEAELAAHIALQAYARTENPNRGREVAEGSEVAEAALEISKQSPALQALQNQHRKVELLRVSLVVNEQPCVAIIDTASNMNLIRSEFAEGVRAGRKPVLASILGTVPGSKAKVREMCEVQVRTPAGECLGSPQECVVLENPIIKHILLGSGFLMETKANIDYLAEAVTLETRKGVRVKLPFEPMYHQCEAPSGVTSLVVRETEAIPPWTQKVLVAQATGSWERVSGKVWVEPIPHGKVLAAYGVADLVGGMTKILVANLSYKAVSLEQGTPLSSAAVLSERQLVVLAHREVEPSEDEISEGLPEDLDLSEAKRELTRKQMRQLCAVLRRARKLFRSPGEKLGAIGVEPMRIETTSEVPIHMAPRRLPPHKMAVAEQEVARMDQMGVTSPAGSAWSFPVVLQPKPSGELRFCVDFRKLNDITVPDTYPLPRCDDLLSALAGAKYFSALDLESGFWQVPLEESSKDKATFAYPGGARRYDTMPFGLKGASAHFQRVMDAVLAGVKWQYCLVYIDDILIFSDTFEHHLEAIEAVFQKLIEHNFKVKPGKCAILKREVKFLGHLVSRQGIKPNPAKVAAVADLPVPKTEKEVRSFLGLTGYFRRFVKDYARIARPLYGEIDEEKGLTMEQREAFLVLRSALTNAPVLAHPRPNDPFIIETDASEFGLGAVLLQEDDGGNLRPVEYASRLIRPHERKWPIREKEALAIVWACGVFKLWLTQQEFEIRTDHQSLQWLNKSENVRLQRWALELMQYQYRIVYKKGAHNEAADFCSRSGMDTNPGHGNSETWPEHAVLASIRVNHDQMRRAQLADVQTAKMVNWLESETMPSGTLSKVKRFRAAAGNFEMVNGLLTRQGAVVVPMAMRSVVLAEIHRGDLAAHLSAEKMMAVLTPRFWWRSMWKDARAVASACLDCARATPYNSGRQGWLRPVTADGPWHTVAMDIKGPWESGIEDETYVLVIMDHYTKYVILVPLQSKEGSGIAKAFLEQVICRFQCPVVVISDNAREFVMGKFKELCERYGIAQKPVLAYHQQANGLVERYMQMLNKMVRIVATEGATDWPRKLCSVAFAYNISYHPTTGNTPYFLNHVRDPRLPIDNWLQREQRNTDIASRTALSRELMSWTARMIEEAQEEMKARYDQHQRESKLREGNLVLVRRENRISKREPLWSELHRVTKVTSDGLNVTVCPVGGVNEEVVSVQRLRPYHPSQLNPWRFDLAPAETDETVLPSSRVTDTEMGESPDEVPEYMETEVLIPVEAGSSGERERRHSSRGPPEPAASESDRPEAHSGQEAPETSQNEEDNLQRPPTPRVLPPEPLGSGGGEQQAMESSLRGERLTEAPPAQELPGPEEGHSTPLLAPEPGEIAESSEPYQPGPLRESPGGGKWYALEKIVHRRRHKGYPQYRIRWKGWGPEHDTWEYEDSIPTDMLNDYLAQHNLPLVEEVAPPPPVPVEPPQEVDPPKRRRRARAQTVEPAPAAPQPKRRRRGAQSSQRGGSVRDK